jgi:hypothetical protein
MSRSLLRRWYKRSLLQGLIGLIVLGSISNGLLAPVHAAQLGSRSLTLSSNTASSQATYRLSFAITTAALLGSIKVQLCANDPFVDDPCTTPTGANLLGSSLGQQSGQTGFAITDVTANSLVLSRTTAAATPGTVSYEINSVTNPSVFGSYYVRLQTYSSSDAGGTATDYGGIAFAITNQLTVSAEVPPYLIFCTGITISGTSCDTAAGNYIDFGEFSSHKASQGSSQMLTATNAASGYDITMLGTTLASGNNVITPLTSNDVSRPGTSQFGINLRANSSPVGGSDPTGPGTGTPSAIYDQPNFYRFNSGEIVASASEPDNVRVYTTSYIANVPLDQAPGIYVSTVTYVCLATF